MAPLLPYVSMYETIQMGYIRQDDCWHFIREIKSLFYNSLTIRNIRPDVTTEAKLEFPLEWYCKEDIFEEYYKNNLDVFNMIFLPEEKADDYAFLDEIET